MSYPFNSTNPVLEMIFHELQFKPLFNVWKYLTIKDNLKCEITELFLSSQNYQNVLKHCNSSNDQGLSI